jgi:RNA polymerase sigma-70 factor (ECF subfamily)
MFGETTFADVNGAASGEAHAGFVMDEDAFRAFYDRTARQVWAYLCRLTGDRQLADDLLQDAYYRFLRTAAVYETEAHQRNSLYRIATNLARDARRRNLLRAPFAVSGNDIETVSAGDATAAAERTTDVARALSHLKPRERAMLWLAYAEGASHEEIAKVLGLRTGSLKAMLFRARQRLAALLEKRIAREKSAGGRI